MTTGRKVWIGVLVLIVVVVGGVLLPVILIVNGAGESNSSTSETGVRNGTSTTTQLPPLFCPAVAWQDEFDGESLKTAAEWSHEVGNGCDQGICGWGNAELQIYQEDNTVVSSGALSILVERNLENFVSSRIRTQQAFRYGHIEARIKLPLGGAGIWPAFWMLPADEDTYGTWPRGGEIDIMENIGDASVFGTVHYNGINPTILRNSARYDPEFTTANTELGRQQRNDFHLFAVEWTPDQIQWSVDGASYHAVQRSQLPYWPFDQAFYILLNVAVGGTWPGNPTEDTVFPQRMLVDYVRVYNMTKDSLATTTTTTTSFGHLYGSRRVDTGQKKVIYHIQDGLSDYQYQWTVPEGASFTYVHDPKVDSSSVLVDFGPVPKYTSIQVEATSPFCGITRQFQLPVQIGSIVNGYRWDFSFAWDPNAGSNVLTQLSHSGYVYQMIQDPAASNPSVIRYVRNSAVPYDAINFGLSNGQAPLLPEPNEYVTGMRQFHMDIRTNAPPGTTIVLQLEDSSIANPFNYPTGRHSRYEATIPLYDVDSSDYLHLTLDILDQPDAGTAVVDSFALLLNPNSYTDHEYFLDRLDVYVQAT